MDNNNNHINYTAADIEKYHKGLLSRSEMHAMEKAAMDDPFLADALEGYAAAGQNLGSDINDINQRLSERIGSAKLISITRPAKSALSTFLRVAAILVFVVGAGLLIYQFGFNNKNQNIAQTKTAPKKEKTNTLE